MAGRFSITAIFKALDKFSAPIGKIERRMQAFHRSADRVSEKLNRASEKSLGGIAKVGAVGAATTAALGAGIMDVVGASNDFEHALVVAGTKFGDVHKGTKAFDALRKSVFDLSETTEFGLVQGADAVNAFAGAGMTWQQTIALMRGTADFASGANLNLAQSAEIATKSLGAFGLMTSDTTQLTQNLGRITDVMAMAVNQTNADLGEMFETIKEGAPVFTTAGQSVESFAALTGKLADATISGSQAGTTLKNVILSLAAPTAGAAAALTSLGITTADAHGNMRDVLDVLEDIEKKTARMGTAKKAATLESIFGRIPLAGVSALLTTGIDKVRALRTELEHSQGALARNAKDMREDGKGSVDRFSASIEALRTRIGEVVSGPLIPLIDGMRAWTKENREVIAHDITAFLDRAIPVVTMFAHGMRSGAEDVADFAGKFSFLLGPLGRFTDESDRGRQSAFNLGSGVVKVAAGVFAFGVITRAASGVTFAFGLAAKVARGAVWLFGIATKAATAETLAARVASIGAAGDLLKQRAAALATAGGMRTLAITTGAAAAAIGALMLAKAANDELKSQTEGLGIGGIISGMFDQGTFDPFKVVDAHQNKLAKERAANEGLDKSGALDNGDVLGNVFDQKWLKSLGPSFAELDKALPVDGMKQLDKTMPGLTTEIKGATEAVKRLKLAIPEPPEPPDDDRDTPPPVPPNQSDGTVPTSYVVPPAARSEVDVSGEIVIHDRSGRAEVVRQPRKGVGLNVKRSGTFL